ncbi:MAG: outer membrane beta-barrel protein [Alphaproteobacteria bacterium]|nr:outer membrane beta-barrel protein [Alphaproteobacteria bacterium]
MFKHNKSLGRLGAVAIAAVVAVVSPPVQAGGPDYGASMKDALAPTADQWAGHWLVRLRATYLKMEDGIDSAALQPGLGGAFGNPTPIPGTEANISNAIIPELDITYFLTNNLAVEVICCVTKHDVDAEGQLFNNVNGAANLLGVPGSGKELGSAWAIPATLLLQYHMELGSGFKPYVGAGPTYAFFVAEDVGGLLSGAASKLKVDNGWGFTLQAGADMAIGNNLYLNADVKKMFLKSDATWTGQGPLAGQALVAKDLDFSPWIFSVGIGMKF